LLGPLDVALDVIEILDRFDIDYVLGGSLASSTFGEPRATNDVDIAAALTATHLGPLVDELRAEGYDVPERSAADAVSDFSSFNVIHPSGLKADLFVTGDNLLDRLQMSRRVRIELPTDPPQPIWVTSPDDQILRKLDWYRLGQEVSDRQWRDILGLIAAQHTNLDLGELRRDAGEAGLGELLERALRTAGRGE
jgi:hypothetical protein